MDKGNGVRNGVRLITVLGILVQMLLVPASQAQPLPGQDQQGQVELAAAGWNWDDWDCTDGTVRLDTDNSEWGTVTVWIGGVQRWSEYQRGDWSKEFTWSDYGLDMCASNAVRAQWYTYYSKYDQSTTIGGGICCPSPTATATSTRTATPTNTRTATATNTPTATATNTRTATATNTATATPTNTRTATPITPTATNTPTATPTNTRTATATNTSTATATNTRTATPTATATNTPAPSLTVNAGCTNGTVSVSAQPGDCGDITVWLDDVQQDYLPSHCGNWSKTYTWSSLGVDVCSAHVLKAQFKATVQSATFGGVGRDACCYVTLTADCAGASVKTYSYNWDWLTVTVDGTTTIYNFWVAPGNPTTTNITWPSSINPCAGHTVVATYRSQSKSATFGGSAACPEHCQCQQTTEWQTVQTGDWYYDAGQQKVCRDLLQHKFDVNDPTHVCDERTIQDCSYVACSETTGVWATTGYGPWHWAATQGLVCRDVYQVMYDKYIPGRVCANQTLEDCTYQECTHVTGVWVTTGYGAWHWDQAKGKVCRDEYQVMYDAYIPGKVCANQKVDDCTYSECAEVTGVWVTTGYGAWHWDLDKQLVCRDEYQVMYDAYIPGKVCREQTIGDCSYALCSEMTDESCTMIQDWTWDPAEQDFFQVWECKRFDKYDTTHLCSSRQEKRWQGYELCDEMTDENCAMIQDWTWDPGRNDFYQVWECKRFDKYDTTRLCTSREEKRWQEYALCSEMTDESCTMLQDWTWDPGRNDFYQVWECKRFDKYDTTHLCTSRQEQRWQGYALCSEMTDESCSMIQDWTWDATAKDFYQVWECKRFDKYDTEHLCTRRQEKRWQGYELCTETVLGGEISRRGPEYENGQLCWWVTYAVLDKHTGESCGATELERCEPYQVCAATSRGRELSREGPFYSESQVCYQVTYELLDAYTEAVCGQETVEECQAVGNGCNHPNLHPSMVRQGQAVNVSFSAWGPGITGIEVYLLGDSRDGPHPSGGGAWYLLAASGPAGGSTAIDTSSLYPKERTVWVKAFYPGGWSNCYGHFTVTPGPTPTLPAPGFVPCPNCVEDIVYQSNKEGQWDIYMASATGRDELRLTGPEGNDTAPAWYPSGQYIAFQTDRDANWEIYTMDADGANQINLTNNAAADEVAPFWSCRYLYFQSNRDGNWEIYRICADGSGEVRLTDNAATDAQPAVSLDERVAFQSNRDGNWEIYTMNADGTGVRRLTNTTWAETSPQFSPNGQWIVYQTNKTGQWEIAVMDLNGQNVRYVVRTASPDESPAWHPYCDWIYFQSMRQGSWDIYRTNQDGTVTQRITTRASSAEMLDDAVDY